MSSFNLLACCSIVRLFRSLQAKLEKTQLPRSRHQHRIHAPVIVVTL